MPMKLQRGVQSIEVGARLIAALAEAERPLGLKELAAQTGMPASKAHRYLVSLGRAGLIEQLATGKYDLGSLSLTAGLAALSRLDTYRIAMEHAASLCEEVNETVFLAVWNGHGAIVIRWEEAARTVAVSVRLGSVLPLIRSATGRIFAAFLPATVTGPLIGDEWRDGAAPSQNGRALSKREFEALIETIRTRKLSVSQGDFAQGIDALSAPIFGADGKLVAALTTLGTVGRFDCSLSGRIAKAIGRHASDASARLGHRATKEAAAPDDATEAAAAGR